jgi:hypothetical protein
MLCQKMTSSDALDRPSEGPFGGFSLEMISRLTALRSQHNPFSKVEKILQY